MGLPEGAATPGAVTQWVRIDELFAHAIELEPTARDAYLDDACAGDDDLRARVLSLLVSAEGARSALRGTVAAAASALVGDAAASYVGRRFGPYRVRAVIGEGGMGTVFLAERDDDQYRHQVAIKVLQGWLASPEIVARFRDERQILAALEHPGIVRLLDGGTTEDRLPYFVMEYVAGVPSARHAGALPVRARVELAVRVCTALQYAHGKLVIHRDIKSSNILVEADGSPKLLDFGIAKLLDARVGGREARTRTGLAFLTPEYASPEQARGDAVSVATDVYSMGAVLYEWLAGTPPQRPGASVLETLRTICEVDPPLPSSLAAPELRRQLRGDLDNIVLKALQKQPVRRYESIAALASDLERYLEGRPIVARDATPLYRARKFVSRHRAPVAVASALLVGLTTATAISVRQARLADQQAQNAQRERRNVLAEQGWQELTNGSASRALPYLSEIVRAGDGGPATRFLLAEALRPLEQQTWSAHDFADGLSGIAWAPDGGRFVATGQLGVLRVYDARGRRLADLPCDKNDLHSPTFSPDGTLLAASGIDETSRVWDLRSGRLQHVLAGRISRPSGPGDRAGLTGVGFDPQGRRLATGTAKGVVTIWSLASGRAEVSFSSAATPSPVTCTVFSSDGARLVVGLQSGAVSIHDARHGRAVARLVGHDKAVGQLRVSPDGTRIYSASSDQTTRIWNARTGAVMAVLPGGSVDVPRFDLSQDGARLVTIGAHQASIWDAHSGKFLAVLAGDSRGQLSSVAFSPDGRRIVTAGIYDAFRVWDASTGQPQAVFESRPASGNAPRAAVGPIDAAFSPDGKHLLTASANELALWNVTHAPLVAELEAPDVYGAALSPDERQVLGVGRNLAGTWEIATGRPQRRFETGAGVLWDGEFSPDGSRVVVVGETGFARIYLSAAAGPPLALEGHQGRVNRGSFDPSGARVLTAGNDHTARIWSSQDAKLLMTLTGHVDRVMAAAWSRQGDRVVTAGWPPDRTLRIWDAATGRQIRQLTGSGSIQFLAVTFSPDGRRVISGGRDGQAEIWDVDSGRRVLSLVAHVGPVTSAVYSPDGALVATSADDGTLRLWDASTGKMLGKRQHAKGVMHASWSHDGQRIVTAAYDRIRLWDVHRDTRSPGELAAFIDKRVPWRLVDGRLEALPR